jgi:hypothetical protein
MSNPSIDRPTIVLMKAFASAITASASSGLLKAPWCTTALRTVLIFSADALSAFPIGLLSGVSK